jgi:hypothetical protein
MVCPPATSEAEARWPRFGLVVVATNSRRDYLDQMIRPYMGPDMGPRNETPIWDPDMRPRYGTPVWYPDMGTNGKVGTSFGVKKDHKLGGNFI